jgi:hypothetical protein
VPLIETMPCEFRNIKVIEATSGGRKAQM